MPLKQFPMFSEQDVLRQLDVPSFRHVSKGKIMSFVSLHRHMDPAVVQKALEQIPDFTKSLTQILSDYSRTVQNGMASNDEHMRSYSAVASANIASLQKELDRSDLSFDERCQVMDRMLIVQEQMSKMVIQNQRFVRKEHIVVGAVVLFCVSTVAAVLGANTSIHFKSPRA